jgi:hypothetical protein
MSTEKKYTFLQMLLVGGIALVTNLFVFYSLEVVKPAPRFENFCGDKEMSGNLTTEETCSMVGGQWVATTTVEEGMKTAGYCNATYTCQKDFQAAHEQHAGLAFLVLTAVGGILFVLSMFIKGSSVVSNGLGLGGLISIFLGSVTNWSYLYPLVKVGLLGALLALILWFAWNKFKD